jgi:nucleoid-associated protein YgaU
MLKNILIATGVFAVVSGSLFLLFSGTDESYSNTRYVSAPINVSQDASGAYPLEANKNITANQRVPAPATPDGASVEQMMSLILADLRGGTPTPAPPKPVSATNTVTDLQSQIVAALSQGKSDAYITQLINGTSSNMTTSSANDKIAAKSQAVLASLVQKSMISPAGQNNSALDLTPDLTNAKKHKVKRGESLATISIRYYGNKDGFAAIFKANKNQLSSPDRIRVGQVLIIPAP